MNYELAGTMRANKVRADLTPSWDLPTLRGELLQWVTLRETFMYKSSDSIRDMVNATIYHLEEHILGREQNGE